MALDKAMREIRAATPPPAPPAFPTWPARNPITGTAGEWDHIPRIAFDADTQAEFGGSRYHTFYVSPEDDCVLDPGLYITDKRTGPELIGASTKKRWFIPHDQLIMR